MALTSQFGQSNSQLGNFQFGVVGSSGPSSTAMNASVPEIIFGPPMYGAPWAQNLFVENNPYQAPAPPAPSTLAYAPEIFSGVPMEVAQREHLPIASDG